MRESEPRKNMKCKKKGEIILRISIVFRFMYMIE